jgi:hypothetical protein
MHAHLTELWFPIGDLLPLVEHGVTRTADQHPGYSAQPVPWSFRRPLSARHATTRWDRPGRRP